MIEKRSSGTILRDTYTQPTITPLIFAWGYLVSSLDDQDGSLSRADAWVRTKSTAHFPKLIWITYRWILPVD